MKLELGGILNCGWEIWGRTAVCLCLCALLFLYCRLRRDHIRVKCYEYMRKWTRLSFQ